MNKSMLQHRTDHRGRTSPRQTVVASARFAMESVVLASFVLAVSGGIIILAAAMDAL